MQFSNLLYIVVSYFIKSDPALYSKYLHFHPPRFVSLRLVRPKHGRELLSRQTGFSIVLCVKILTPLKLASSN